MATVKIILWIGIGVALAFHGIYLLIKYNNMIAELEKIKTILETAEGKERLVDYKLSEKQVLDRLEDHYKRFDRLNRNKKNPSTWKFTDITDPERLLNEVALLIQADELTERKRSVMSRLKEIPEKKMLWALNQIEAIVDLAADSANSPNDLEDTVDVEFQKLEQDQKRLDARIADYKARKAAARNGREAQE